MFRAFSSIPGGVRRLAARQAPLLAGSLLVAAAVVAGALALANYSYDRHVREASDAIANLSYVVADHADRSMTAVNQSVSKVAEALQARQPDSAAALEALADAADIRSMLDAIVVDNPFLDSVFVIGADGEADSRSRGEMIPPELIAGGEYMAALQRSSPGGVYLSSPFQSYRFNSWTLNFSARVSSPGGAFLGAVAGIVKLASFSDLFDKMNLPANGSISLFSGDGRLLSWAPQSQMPFGASLTGTALYQDFVLPRHDGVTRARSPVDGVERLLAVANAPDFPVSAVIAAGMPDIVAGWRGEARWLAVFAGLAILAIFVGAARLAFHVDKVTEERQRRAVEKLIAEQAATLANAIENIVQGLAMFDRRGGLVLYNTRYAEMYGLPLDKFKVGVTRAETIDPRQSGDLRELFERVVAVPGDRTLSYLYLRDGRVIAQRKKMLRDGGWVSTHEDVTAKRAAEERIQVMATRDSLTGLFNRFEFKNQLDQRVSESRRHGVKFAVLHVSLDRFKKVNDTLGHPIGDELLRCVAARLSSCVREDDVVARLGGDEFAVLQRAGSVPRNVTKLAERLIAALSEPYVINGDPAEIAASVGVSVTPDDSGDADGLMRNADLALRQAKQSGGGAYRFFTPAMDEQIRARRELEIDLKAAVADHQFELCYQPVVSTKDRAVKSFEALIRWRHPQRGRTPPTEFIPLAEETGLIVPIGEWVLGEACRMAATLPADVKVGVNVSPVQFSSEGFLSSVSSALENAGVDGSRLIVEITESVMTKDPQQAIRGLHALRDLGIAIAMDDFGTGHSSLSYMRKFPFDKVKIDKSFVGVLGVDSSAATIVRSAAALASALGMASVAEGVETEDQMSFLVEAGCAEAQGYLISRPLPALDVYAFLGLKDPLSSALSEEPQESAASAGASRAAPPIAAADSRESSEAGGALSATGPPSLRRVPGKPTARLANLPVFLSKTTH